MNSTAALWRHLDLAYGEAGALEALLVSRRGGRLRQMVRILGFTPPDPLETDIRDELASVHADIAAMRQQWAASITT